jgi:hypothetical protein
MYRGLVMMASLMVRREPDSPLRAQPIASWALSSLEVVRTYGVANPSRRSAKIQRGHSRSGQKKQQTVIRTWTALPKQGKSASRRIWRLWTRRACEPQRGQGAVDAVVSRKTVKQSTLRTK